MQTVAEFMLALAVGFLLVGCASDLHLAWCRRKARKTAMRALESRRNEFIAEYEKRLREMGP